MDYKTKIIENLINNKANDNRKRDKTFNLINPKHRKTIKDYVITRREIVGSSSSTILTDVNALVHLSNFLKNKKFSDATKKDMINWMSYMKTIMSDKSAQMYGTRIKHFYKYVSDPEEYEKTKQERKNIPFPDNVKWIDTNIYDKNEQPLETLLTDDQILKMLEVSDIREQALTVILLDCGLRIGEAVSLKVKSVGFDKRLGAYFILPKKRKNTNGSMKTGSRTIQSFLIPSTTAIIKEYINRYHKFRSDPNAPLFYSGRMGNPLTERGAYNLIVNLVKRAGIKDKLTPHSLRHNSATRCAKVGFNEPELRIRYGWSRSSDMPSKYVHLASRDLSDKICKIKGITKDEILKNEKLAPWTCPNCQHENIPSNIICGRCGMKKEITKKDLGIDATTTGIATQELIKDPEFREFYNEMLLATIEKYQEMKERK